MHPSLSLPPLHTYTLPLSRTKAFSSYLRNLTKLYFLSLYTSYPYTVISITSSKTYFWRGKHNCYSGAEAQASINFVFNVKIKSWEKSFWGKWNSLSSSGCTTCVKTIWFQRNSNARIPESKLTINSGYLQMSLVSVLWNYHLGFSSQSASRNDRNSKQIRLLQVSYQTPWKYTAQPSEKQASNKHKKQVPVSD